VFAFAVTLLLFGQGMMVGHYLGPWGALASIALGFTEGHLAMRWALRRWARRKL
jgi:uncharacterized membrane protein YdjX (TVP38/TMEM64 family)